MTLQSHSTAAVNRFPVNCILGSHSIRCQEIRFEDVIIGGDALNLDRTHLTINQMLTRMRNMLTAPLIVAQLPPATVRFTASRNILKTQGQAYPSSRLPTEIPHLLAGAPAWCN